MIRFHDVSVRFETTLALREVDLSVPEGEFCLVVGPTGSGKSTLLSCVNGHVPHFTGGTLTGSVTVDGRDTREWRPRDLADVVGRVAQDPARGFVCDRVEDELAFTMESLALPVPVMRRRVEDTLDLLGLTELRDRPLASLSGGQQQRVAIGAALTGQPRVLVLDEPTSSLDPGAAEEVLGALHRLVHDLGVTVLLAEHRLERVLGFADSVILIQDGRARFGAPAEIMAESPIVPPVVELGRLSGWQPLPLTVREARRRAPEVISRLVNVGGSKAVTDVPSARAQATGLVAGFDQRVRSIGPLSLGFGEGQLIGLMGRNGAGKSTLLWSLAGALDPQSGTVTLDGRAPRSLRPRDRRHLVTLVPQQPSDLLYQSTVGAELAQADTDADASAGAARRLLDRIGPGIDDDTHPRDLSEGQRMLLVLAIQLTAAPRLLLLDEPTRGLDYPGKARLTALLIELGVTVLVASHDVEFVAATCDRVVMLADGRVLADGPTAEVVTASPVFAPQVAKVLAPLPLLTVAQVRQALR